jgi:UDP-N-acetylglucosamine diphosphorylase/glucosamine-1-phosphate N-acetyltransferase
MVELVRQRVAPTLQMPVAINVPLDEEPALIIAGRTLHFSDYEIPPGPGVCLEEGDVVRSAYVHSPGLGPADAMTRSDQWLKLLELPHMMPQSRLVQHPWDLLSWNEESIVADFVTSRHEPRTLPAGPYHVVEPSNVMLGKDVRLAPGCVLDASTGPILIGDGATIGANAVLTGPVSIGDHAVIAPLAQIRRGTSIGPQSKVGGEVSNSIFLGRSSKSHDGFVGDSYIGEWVNLGAGTTTSNLKNTYDEVSVPLAGVETMTGRRFVGSIIGDHAKTAVETRLMTGSYIGYSAMVAASRITPRYVPSYTFLTDRATELYRQDKAIDVMRAVMNRRSIPFTALDQAIATYAATAARAVEKPL